MPGPERPHSKIPTKNPQPARTGRSRRRAAAAAPQRAAELAVAGHPAGGGAVDCGGRRAASRAMPGGLASSAPTARSADAREVIATADGITVYPARWEGDRWRAVWYEPDGSRGQCQAASEERLVARLAAVCERLAADAPNMQRTGDELITHYLPLLAPLCVKRGSFPAWIVCPGPRRRQADCA